MNDLTRIDAWVDEMLAGLSPSERRKALWTIARDLRRIQMRNIAAQREPDGRAFAPRKSREMRGQIRRAARGRAGQMFKKLRTARHLKASVNNNEATVGFTDNATGRIANIHHHGLRDRVSRQPGSPLVSYIRRRLIGFPPGFEDQLLDQILHRLDR